jgi:hypothetical protein
VQGVAYDKATQTLYVQFKGDAEYAYYDVPQEEYEALLSAPSVGQALNDNIKSVYSYARV